MSERERSIGRERSKGEKRFIHRHGVEIDDAFLNSEQIPYESIKEFVGSLLYEIGLQTEDQEQKILLILDVLNPKNFFQVFDGQIEAALEDTKDLSEEDKLFFKNVFLFLRQNELDLDMEEIVADRHPEPALDIKNEAVGEIASVVSKTALQYVDSAKENVPSVIDFVSMIESTIASIREAVVQELGNHLEPDQYVLLKKEISAPYEVNPLASRIVTTHNPRTKQNSVFRNTYHIVSPEKLAARQEVFRAGCAKLMEAGEHPNILPIFGFDSQKLEIHVPERKLLTLREIYDKLPRLSSVEERRKVVVDLLRLLCDGASGAEFLAKNGLVLEDLKLENIAKDLDRDIGVLFDLDFIVEIGKRRKIYPVVSKSYCPPEWTEISGSVIVPSEKEMVYELGVALKNILLSPRIELAFSELGPLTGLVSGMVKKNPEKRLKISDSVHELKSIISSFPENYNV